MANRRNLGCELRDLIFYLYEDTLVPDLFDMLGEDLAIKFIQVFGGMKIEIPPYKHVLDLQRDIEVYESISYVPSEETIKVLADKYAVTRVWIREIYKNMRRKYPSLVKYMEKMNEENLVHVTTQRNCVLEGDLTDEQKTLIRDSKEKEEQLQKEAVVSEGGVEQS